MTLSLDSIVPGTIGAMAQGCMCPGPRPGMHYQILMIYNGLLFDPRCPVHHHAVAAELQRVYGRSQ